MHIHSIYVVGAVLLGCTLGQFMRVSGGGVACPDKCHCSHGDTVVKCVGGKLTTIPTGIPPSVKELFLGNNVITSIQNDSFAGLKNLKMLDMRQNHIAKIHHDAFADLENLEDLFLTKNELSSVPKEAVRFLKKLKRLYLTSNHLEEVPDLGYMTSLTKLIMDTNKIKKATLPGSFVNLKKLTSIVLANNDIYAIGKTDLAPLGKRDLGKLSFSRNKIRDITSGAFEQLGQVTTLSFSYNPLKPSQLKYIVDGLSSSRVSNLDLSNTIPPNSGKLPPETFDAMKGVPLHILKLNHNGITLLVNNTFKYLRKLKELHLDYCEIGAMESATFNGLNSLQRLVLHHNRLKVIPPFVFPPSLVTLDLSYNSDLETLPHNTFYALTNIENLYLSHCSLRVLYREVFTSLVGLTVLDMSYNKLAGNSLSVDMFENCDNLKFLKLNKNNFQNMGKEGHLFQNLRALLMLDLSDNGCTELPKGLLAPLGNLTTLWMKGNKLEYVLQQNPDVFKGLNQVTEIYLSKNDLSFIPSSLFKGLTSLQYLYLEDNAISHWSPDAFSDLHHLRLLQLASNQITLVNQTSVGDFKEGLTLNLTDNPFMCWCDLVWFRNWLDSTNVTLASLDRWKCASPDKYAGKQVKTFIPKDIDRFCHIPPWELIISCSVGGMLLLVTMVFTIVYKYRWSIRLQLYYCRQGRANRPKDGYEPLHGTQTKYDLILLYLEGDEPEEFIEQHFIPVVHEQNHPEGLPGLTFGERFTIFYEKADLPPNESEIGSWADAMDASKKAVVVLTDGFSQDSKCRFKLDLVIRNKLVAHGEESVILIALDDKALHRIPKPLHGRLKDDAANCLRWKKDTTARRLFWEQLQGQILQDPHKLVVNA